MNPMSLMMMASPAVVNQPSIKTETGRTEGTPFMQLLGNLLANESGNLAEEEVAEEDSEQILAFLKQWKDDGMFLTEESLEKEEISELLSLLPKEWQEDFYQLALGNEVDVLDWSQWQQMIFALLLANEQPTTSAKDEMTLQNLQQAVVNRLPMMPLAGNATELLEEIVRYINGQVNEEGKANGQAFTELLTKKTNRTLPFPTSTYQQITPEISQTGANMRVEQGLTLTQSGQELGQAMTRAEQATIQLGENLPKEVQQQQFLRQFQLILNRGIFTQQGQGVSSLSIKLFPEHLGRVDVQLTQIEGTIVAKILASSSASKEMIESQISQLRNAFLQQQIPVERIEVAEQYLGKEKEEQSSKERDDERRNNEEKEKEERIEFNDLLHELTFDEEV